MPLFHVHGLLAGFLAPLFSGGSAIVPNKFSASEFWDNFITYKANWYTAVPTIHQILLRSPMPSNMPTIRFIRSCSSPLPPKTFHELENAFGAPVLEAYAMTEAAHQMTSNPLPPAKRLPGSVGIGQGVEVKVLDQEGKPFSQTVCLSSIETDNSRFSSQTLCRRQRPARSKDEWWLKQCFRMK